MLDFHNAKIVTRNAQKKKPPVKGQSFTWRCVSPLDIIQKVWNLRLRLLRFERMSMRT